MHFIIMIFLFDNGYTDVRSMQINKPGKQFAEEVKQALEDSEPRVQGCDVVWMEYGNKKKVDDGEFRVH